MMMEEVIRLGEEGDHEAILNLGGKKIDAKVKLDFVTALLCCKHSLQK